MDDGPRLTRALALVPGFRRLDSQDLESVAAASELELARVPVAALEEYLASNAPVASEFARLIDLRKELAEP